MCCIVKPVGFTIPVDATRIHGITTQQALAEGVDIKVALLDMFAPLLAKADRVVTFNGRPVGWSGDRKGGFDVPLVISEASRLAEVDDVQLLMRRLGHKPHIDVMSLSFLADCAKIKTRTITSRGKTKTLAVLSFIKLSVLFEKLMGRPMARAHRADADVEATAACLWRLNEIMVARGQVPLC
jgi:hypothetical protein